MTHKKRDAVQELRWRAEQDIAPPLDQSDMAKVLHELEVHQVELEMQNEQLRHTQQELETSRTRYFDLYNLAPVGYCTIDKQGLILEANLTVATQLGVARGVLIQQPLTGFISARDKDVYARNCRQLFETGAPQVCEVRLQHLDAVPFWARLEGNISHEADGSPLCRLVIIDITVAKQMEEALRQSEEKYRTVADFTHDWEFWLGPEGDFLYCSPSCKRITGYSAAAFENDPSLLRTRIHPDDLAAYDLHRQQDQNRISPLEFELRINHAEGSMGWRWISHVCQAVFDDQGQFLGIRGSNRDVTERKLLEAEVEKTRKIESLGILAGGVCHDFNNLFQALFGNISLAKMYTEESSKAYPFLENAAQLFKIVSKLTGQLIAFSSGGISSLINFEPASHIKQEVAFSLAGTGMVAQFDLADDLRSINIDPIHFHQVIKQIVQNAKEAMASCPGGILKVMAVNEPLLEISGKPIALPPGNYVMVSIQDQGCGINGADLPRIFNPYFSTKQRGSEKGTGLGLALCDAIIRRHGGAITVQSNPGEGTTFHILIPAVEPVAQVTTTTKDQEATGPQHPLDIGCGRFARNNRKQTIPMCRVSPPGHRI